MEGSYGPETLHTLLSYGFQCFASSTSLWSAPASAWRGYSSSARYPRDGRVAGSGAPSSRFRCSFPGTTGATTTGRSPRRWRTKRPRLPSARPHEPRHLLCSTPIGGRIQAPTTRQSTSSGFSLPRRWSRGLSPTPGASGGSSGCHGVKPIVTSQSSTAFQCSSPKRRVPQQSG